MEPYQLVGKKIRAKLVRRGYPEGIVKVTNVQGAHMGNVRGVDEEGNLVMALYPPIEVL